MTGALARPALRARIAQALGDIIADEGTRSVGERVGCSSSTVSRRGDSLEQWPSRDLLDLAASAPRLAAAISAFLGGYQVDIPRPLRAMAELSAELATLGRTTTAIAEAMSDGAITPAEAAGIATQIRASHDQEQQLLRDLDALASGGR